MALVAVIATLPPAPVPTPTVPPLSPATRPPLRTETWLPAFSVTSPPWPPPKVLVDTTLSCPETVIVSAAVIDTLPLSPLPTVGAPPSTPPLSEVTLPPLPTLIWLALRVTSPPAPSPWVVVETELPAPDTLIALVAVIDTLPLAPLPTVGVAPISPPLSEVTLPPF